MIKDFIWWQPNFKISHHMVAITVWFLVGSKHGFMFKTKKLKNKIFFLKLKI
jgi:hypothetical protein